MSEVFLNISAGGGPKECQWVVVKLAHAYCKEAKAAGLTADILWDESAQTLAASLLLKIKGAAGEQFCRPRIGTVRWVWQSPFRKNHKRKNWYVGVTKASDIADIPSLNEGDIKYQTMKASGPGGQHVNKTESAVRATHLPTGLTVVASEQRSQFANKKLTRIKLALLLEAQKEAATNQAKDKLWASHKSLERGNEVRVYQGTKFK